MWMLLSAGILFLPHILFVNICLSLGIWVLHRTVLVKINQRIFRSTLPWIRGIERHGGRFESKDRSIF